jgi:hypothetical protein
MIDWDAEIARRTAMTRQHTVGMFDKLDARWAMTEHDMTAALLRKLRAHYPEAWVHKVNERISGGVPDVEFIFNGKPLKIECKGPTTPVTELQIATMNKLLRAGQTVLLLRFTGHGTEHALSLFAPPDQFIPVGMDLFSHIEVTCRR